MIFLVLFSVIIYTFVLNQALLSHAGAGAFSGQRERHAVPAQTLEQAYPERQGALHTYAAVVTGPAGPEPQPAPEPGPRSG